MSEPHGFDAYSPAEIARRVEAAGVSKAHTALLPLAMLAVLAGAFIGLGAMLSVMVKADATLGFAASTFLAGLVFSLGLLMVVVAGAELLTGNNLLVMAWAEQRIRTGQLLRHWAIVGLGNLVGAVGLAGLVWASGHTQLHAGAIGQKVVQIALAKQELPFWSALLRGVLCNVLVCMAVWMAMAGRSVVDKAVAVVFPVMAFVAAGFEHSIANMYLMPQALMLQASGLMADGPALTLAGMLGNWAAVLLGNLLGGAGLVGLVYWAVYLRPPRD
ncbi:MAG: formate/nitrite transporter family protein [Limnohabitans sp.]